MGKIYWAFFMLKGHWYLSKLFLCLENLPYSQSMPGTHFFSFLYSQGKGWKIWLWHSESVLQIFSSNAVEETGISCKSKPQWGAITCQLEWLLSKSLQAINAGEGVEKREPSYTVGGNANSYCHMTQQSHFWAYTPRKLDLKETHVPNCSTVYNSQDMEAT